MLLFGIIFQAVQPHVMARLYGWTPWKWIAPALGVGVGAAYKGPLKGRFKGPIKGVYGHLKDQMAIMRSCNAQL